MIKNGFLRFCNDTEIACCKAEKELEFLRNENAELRTQLAVSQRRGQAAVEALHQVQFDIDCAECRCDLDDIKGYIDDEIVGKLLSGPQEAGE